MQKPDFEDSEPILIPDLLAFGLILAWGLYWLAPGLNHPSIHNWDESFHQAVTRGTVDAFPAPTMYVEPFYPLKLRDWWYAGIWMHKAAAVFWWGALMIKLFGVSTAAMRSASLLGQLGIALLTYLLTRGIAGRPLALATSLAFLLLPWGWFMTQGHFVADVTDISVTAFVTLGIAWLWWAVEKDSLKWAALAGAAVGVGYLTKTFLCLDPLGVAGAWWLLARLKVCKGPSFKQLVVVFVAFAAVAAPWNIYAALKWPDVYFRAFEHTTNFIGSNTGEDVGPGWRPADAIFHEINWTLLKPIPYTLALFAGIWLAIKAVRERDGRVIAIALWLWSTWIVHSLTHVKGHGHLWNVLPAVFAAFAVLLRDAWRYRPLAVGVITSLLVWQYKLTLPFLAGVKAALPAKWIQTRSWEHANTVEQFFFVPLAIAAAWLLSRALQNRTVLAQRLTLATGALASAGAFAFAFPINATANLQQQKEMDHDRHWSASEDLGLALDPVIEKKSAFYMDTNFDYGVSFEYLNLMFWSGRMVYRQPADPQMASAHGYHPYLVSPASEPFAPMDQVPPYAGLRAYDLLKPGPPAPLPAGLNPLDVPLANLHVLGWAARALDDRWSRYAFYVQPLGYPSDARVRFNLDNGTSVEQVLQIASTLRPPQRLIGAPWFVLGAVGPPHAHVTSIQLGQ